MFIHMIKWGNNQFKKNTLPPLNLCLYTCLNEETIGLKKTLSHLLIYVLYICLNEETIGLKKTPSHLLIYVYTCLNEETIGLKQTHSHLLIYVLYMFKWGNNRFKKKHPPTS